MSAPCLSPTYSIKTERSEGIRREIIFGSLSGSVGKLFEYPFDTIKVRLQSQRSHSPTSATTHPAYKGPLDCFQQSVRLNGLRGLYRGISAPLLGAAAETSSLFFSYKLAQSFLKYMRSLDQCSPASFSIVELTCCGAISGAITSLILTPIELVKCKMQVSHPLYLPSEFPVQSHRHPPSLIMIIRSIHRHQGLLGFWRGQLGTLIRETGGSASWFGSYEAVCLMFRQNQSDESARSTTFQSKSLPLHQQILAGASAGVSYSFLFYPADTIKSRIQTEDVIEQNFPNSKAVKPLVNTRTKPSFASVGLTIWKNHGIRGLYRGCGLTVARAAPSSALIFTIYEALQEYFP